MLIKWYGENRKNKSEKSLIYILELAADRAVKNFTTKGNYNCFFEKIIHGAQASTTVYSIPETVMLNGVKPNSYLIYIMKKMKDLGSFPEKGDLLELLFWSIRQPLIAIVNWNSKRAISHDKYRGIFIFC